MCGQNCASLHPSIPPSLYPSNLLFWSEDSVLVISVLNAIVLLSIFYRLLLRPRLPNRNRAPISSLRRRHEILLLYTLYKTRYAVYFGNRQVYKNCPRRVNWHESNLLGPIQESKDTEKVTFQLKSRFLRQKSRLFGPKNRLFEAKKPTFWAEKPTGFTLLVEFDPQILSQRLV